METKEALECLSALAHEGRLGIVRLLVGIGQEGLVAGEIGERLAIPASTLSAHLAVIERAGLVRSVREGRHVRYIARMEGMQQLIAFLVADCCGGSPEQCEIVLNLKPCC